MLFRLIIPACVRSHRACCASDAGLLGAGALALLLSSFSNAAAPALLRAVMDGAKASASGPHGGNGGGAGAAEKAMLVKAMGVFMVGALGSWVRTRCLGTVSARVARRLRRQLMAALLSQEAAYFDKAVEAGGLSVADAANRLGSDVDAVAKAVTSNLSNVLR